MTQHVALVTGGNRGIGLATCARLAASGMTVVLAARGREAAARAAARAAGPGAGPLYPVTLDVTLPRQIERVKERVLGRFGRLDVLVNNAGVYLDEGTSVFDVELEVVRRTLQVNFYGPLRLVRAFVPGMVERGYGRVVNVSSGAGQLTDMGGEAAAYRVSKTALDALTRIVAAETAGTGVKVNAICPGWVRTAMGGSDAPRDPDDAARSIAWAATLPEEGPTGGLFRDREPIPW